MTPGHGRLTELADVFLRLGLTAFGGPAAHIALMEDEVVRRRGWLTREEFLDGVGVTNLIPGPNSTELAILIGQRRGGWAGLLVAGICFILPAAVLVGVLAWGYVTWGALPDVRPVLAGVSAVIIAVVGQALVRLGRTALGSGALLVVALGAVAAVLAGVNELIVLVAGGAAMAVSRTGGSRPSVSTAVAPVTTAMGAADTTAMGAAAATAAMGAAAATAATTFSLGYLFVVFLKIGAVLFGSGYVLLAFLRADFVERLGWLTERQLLDAVAAGQVTPGPLFTTATFVGYLLAGVPGAVVATIGIFLPAFLLVAAGGRFVPYLRRSPRAAAALDGVNAASLALMAVVSWQLARAAVVDPITLSLALLSGLLLIRFRVNSLWLILAGGAIGWIFLR